MSKLTSYDKATIKEWYATQDYTQAELAEIYGVGRSTIQRVLNEPDFLPEHWDFIEDGHEMGTSPEPVGTECPEPESDLPGAWFGWAMLALSAAGAAFVGWLVYNAL